MDDTRWPEALQALTDYTGSEAATFWVLDGAETPRLPTLTVINFDPRFVEAYQDMVPFDPTNLYLLRHPEERIVHDAMVISEREKDRHPYYDGSTPGATPVLSTISTLLQLNPRPEDSHVCRKQSSLS